MLKLNILYVFLDTQVFPISSTDVILSSVVNVEYHQVYNLQLNLSDKDLFKGK